MRITTPIVVAMLVALSPLSHAQSQKPGLWEHSSTVHAHGGQMSQQMAEMKKQMAGLPPEQRKAMEQMMGLSVASDGPTISVKHCITPEEAAKAWLPSHDEECKYTITQRTASSVKAKFVCSDEGKSSGEGVVHFKGDNAYSGKFNVNTLVDGKPERMEMTQTGKWLSAQCGNVKPVQSTR
ncbi:MAG: DUF3617 domain-containing protein [Hydrogenophaga sp.]|uniref:DUF3617 domain-containing protein n=1 Tax=Hydrogenophaga sp. TaxID=1904254 RepID=UPI0027613767|nr:DUF3617 domain-containing protein [Hydrogenophaga sp.]MDP2417117.1 DUF3617 domain-containing protein [Hydrogenophaga sp.]MDZ4189123.1 DUF3617 domain-containing protein [Hydrogenophaga sp.]